MKRVGLVGFLFVCLFGVPSLASSQIEEAALHPPLEWRNIGLDRGGRSIAVAGHRDRLWVAKTPSAAKSLLS
jgi:hypothetical protein